MLKPKPHCESVSQKIAEKSPETKGNTDVSIDQMRKSHTCSVSQQCHRVRK